MMTMMIDDAEATTYICWICTSVKNPLLITSYINI